LVVAAVAVAVAVAATADLDIDWHEACRCMPFRLLLWLEVERDLMQSEARERQETDLGIPLVLSGAGTELPCAGFVSLIMEG
jgi:hypothetical protein